MHAQKRMYAWRGLCTVTTGC